VPTVSIIVANYNKEKYLADALESVRRQTFTNWECIVVDDGSTDDSRKIIKRFVAKDPRFRAVFQENSGACAARNSGLRIAKGEFVMFLDADDAVCIRALELLVMAAEEHQANIVGGRAVPVSEEFRYLPIRDDNEYNIKTPMLVGGATTEILIKLLSARDENFKWLWIWRYLFRRQLLQGKWFIEELWFGDDICFMLSVMHCAQKIAVVNVPVNLHRLSKNSITQQRFNPERFRWFGVALRAMHELRSDYSKKFWEVFYKSFMKYVFADGFSRPMKNPEFRQSAASVIREVYGTPAFPVKYLTRFQRILLWLFVRGFGE
jgi:glycosyltransferase EpsJ